MIKRRLIRQNDIRKLTDFIKKIKFSEWSTLLCKRQDLIEPLDTMFSEEQNSKCDQEERAYTIVDNRK